MSNPAGILFGHSVRLSRSLLSLQPSAFDSVHLSSAFDSVRLSSAFDSVRLSSAFKPSTVQPATDLFRAASTTSQPFKPSDLFRLQLL
uniref:Uncharacterized protein n=1 Tax=Fagus sylvatica TaxID=28930 RepID=A0A2N9IM01_FAGSY